MARAGPAPLVSILVPVYNEVRTLPQVLRALGRLKVHKEILIIDDGSTDGSSELLNRLAVPGFRVLRHARNLGKGAAIRPGLAAAQGRFTLLQDADLETDPGDIPRLLRPLMAPKGELAVFGTRFHTVRPARLPRRNPDQPQAEGSPPWRTRLAPLGRWGLTRLTNRLLTGATNALFGSALTDVACAYKAMSTRLLRSLRLRSNRFEVEAENF